MKRIGRIFDAVCEPDNLRLAFWRASLGKRHRADQRGFQEKLETELAALREGLANGTYPVGRYRRFLIHDPKEREICAAAFGERVLHHALLNVCEPFFDAWLVPVSFASRKGYGQVRAVRAAQTRARRFDWYLQCDVRKFFDSIPHDRLFAMLARKFKDERLLAWFARIIGSYETTSGRGLPIGNYTSQHFANLYLDAVDRTFPARAYVRYMDDFILWSNDRAHLKAERDRIRTLLREELGLELKTEPRIARTSQGMNFLGMRVYPGRIRLARASRDRYRRKSKLYRHLLETGVWDEETYQTRATALLAFVETADSRGWRGKIQQDHSD